MVRGAAVGDRGGSVQRRDRWRLWLLTRPAAERTSTGFVVSRYGTEGCKCASRTDARQGEQCFCHVQIWFVAADEELVPGAGKGGRSFMTNIAIAAGIAVIGFVLAASSVRIVQ
jgi:hypothetical protein